MEVVLSSCGAGGVDIFEDRKLPTLKHAEDVFTLSKDPSKLQAFVGLLSDGESTHGTQSAPLECKKLLQDQIG